VDPVLGNGDGTLELPAVMYATTGSLRVLRNTRILPASVHLLPACVGPSTPHPFKPRQNR